ncbi:MAG: hypothetical protein KAG26_05695 [Methylococcales bacterium]|nr:hypothetical protein [Methylococcales bacterium]
MTDNELKELVASLAILQKETDEQLKKISCQIQELLTSQEETDFLDVIEIDKEGVTKGFCNFS